MRCQRAVTSNVMPTSPNAASAAPETKSNRNSVATAVASDPHTAAGDLLDAILVRSPDSVAASKRIFDDTWHAGARRTFARERAEQARLLFARNTAIARKVANGAAKADYAPRPR